MTTTMRKGSTKSIQADGCDTVGTEWWKKVVVLVVGYCNVGVGVPWTTNEMILIGAVKRVASF